MDGRRTSKPNNNESTQKQPIFWIIFSFFYLRKSVQGLLYLFDMVERFRKTHVPAVKWF